MPTRKPTEDKVVAPNLSPNPPEIDLQKRPLISNRRAIVLSEQIAVLQDKSTRAIVDDQDR
jgi:hypothetical protein